jgi:hypothetical protein
VPKTSCPFPVPGNTREGKQGQGPCPGPAKGTALGTSLVGVCCTSVSFSAFSAAISAACAAISARNFSVVAVRFIESLNRNPPTVSRTICTLQQLRRGITRMVKQASPGSAQIGRTCRGR